MQQLDMMDIAGNKIGVKVAPMSAGETAQLAANAARIDLDDEGGKPLPWKPSLFPSARSMSSTGGPEVCQIAPMPELRIRLPRLVRVLVDQESPRVSPDRPQS